MSKKKIGLTGSTGFLGIASRIYFTNKGYNVIVISKDDICQGKVYDSLDVIIHLAWSGVRGSMKNSLVEQQENLMIAKYIAMLTKRNGAHLIAFGSQAEYALNARLIKENSLISPRTIYGKTKVDVHKYFVQELSRIDCVKLTWLRLFDPYGPGDKPYWLIPSVIDSIKQGKLVEVTYCEQVWDFIFVTDVCRAIEKIFLCNAEGVYNLCSGEHVSLKEVIKVISNIMLSKYGLKTNTLYGAKQYEDGGPMNLRGCSDKLSCTTGWSPMVSLRRGLELTVADRVS